MKIFVNFSIMFLVTIVSLLTVSQNSEAQLTPVTKGDSSASLTTDLINDVSDYDTLLSESNRLLDKKIYKRDVTTVGNLPLVVSYSGSSTPNSVGLDSSLINKLVNHTMRASIGDSGKLQSVDFYILQNETFPVTRLMSGSVTSGCADETSPNGTAIRTCFINDTRVFAEEQDWRYEWKRLKDLSTLTIQRNQKIIVNIEGKFKISTTSLSVDVVPSFSISGVSFSFPEYAWWDANPWQNRKQQTVKSNLSSSATNLLYVVNWTRTANDGANCQDFRWINGTDDTSRAIYQEHCNSTTTYASYTWVNDSLQSGTGNQTRYRYYNNPSAENVSLNPSPFGAGHTVVYVFNNSVSNVVDTANSGTNNNIAFKTTDCVHGICMDTGNQVGYIDLDSDTWIDINTQYTIAMWVKFYRTDINQGMLEMTNTNRDGVLRRQTDGKIYYTCQFGTIPSYSWTPILNKWYHIATTSTGGGGTAKLYIDGVLVQSATNPCDIGGSYQANRYTLGRYQNSVTGAMEIDSFILSKSIYSDDQIMALANTTNIEETAEDRPPTPFDSSQFRNIWNNNTQTVFLNNSFKDLSLNITSLNASNQGNFTQINTTDLKATRTIEALTFIENAVSLVSKYLQLSGGTLTGNLISQLIRPSSDLAYDLGTDTFRFRNVWAQLVNASSVNTTIINGTDITASFLRASTIIESGTSLANKYLQLGGGSLTGTLTAQMILAASGGTYDIGSAGTRFRAGYFNTSNSTNISSTQANITDATVGTLRGTTIYEGGTRFPQPITCSGNNKIAVFNSDGTFTCQEDKIRLSIMTKLCDAKNCTVTDIQSGYNITVWAKGVYDGPANPQQVRLFQNTTLADQNQVDIQSTADADSFALIHYMTTNSSNDVTYIVDSTAGTLNNTKIMIQVAR